MASSRKKVIVRRFSTGVLWGYLPAAGILQDGALDLLDLSGRVQSVPILDVKYVSYVRDFNTADAVSPERLVRKNFLARPRSEGLWMRVCLRDGDRIEGLASLDLTMADGWSEDLGVYLVPPDIRGNTQRLYIPRSGMDSMEVVAVVTTPSRKKAALAKSPEEAQPDLFSLPLPPGARTN